MNFPTDLKLSEVYPKFRKGNLDPKSSRPLSLIPILASLRENSLTRYQQSPT